MTKQASRLNKASKQQTVMIPIENVEDLIRPVISKTRSRGFRMVKGSGRPATGANEGTHHADHAHPHHRRTSRFAGTAGR